MSGRFENGVDKDIRTMLMRHTGDIASHYIDLPREKILVMQLQCLSGFPTLWPENVGKVPTFPLKGVDRTVEDRSNSTVTLATPHASELPSAPAPGAASVTNYSVPCARADRNFGQAAFCGVGFGEFNQQVVSSNADYGTQPLDTNDLAEFFASLSRLLRKGQGRATG